MSHTIVDIIKDRTLARFEGPVPRLLDIISLQIGSGPEGMIKFRVQSVDWRIINGCSEATINVGPAD